MVNKEDFLRKDIFARELGIVLQAMDVGYARASLTITQKHLNGAQIAHGGVVFSLADFTFAAASNAKGELALAINANINFLAPTLIGETLIAEAKELSRSKRLGSYEIKVTKSDESLVATFSGTVYVKS